MQKDQAVDYVRQIGATKTINSIVITGGEPFLDLKLIRAITAEADKHDLSSRMVTNAFWATSETKIKEILSPLVDHGLVELNISYDAAHEKFVPLKNVQQAVHHALNYDIQVVVTSTSLGNLNEERIKSYTEALNLPKHENLTFLHSLIAPGGRASKTWSHEEMNPVAPETPEGARLKVPCPYVLYEPVITPIGNVSACCGTTISTRVGFHPFFLMGNIHNTPLQEILDHIDYDPLWNIIFIEGPFFLYEKVRQRDPTVFKRDRFVNICDLCKEVICEPKSREILKDIIPEESEKILVKKMMLDTM